METSQRLHTLLGYQQCHWRERHGEVGHTSEKWKSTIVTSGGRRSATDMKWKWRCDIVPEMRKINGPKSQRHMLARDGSDSSGEKKKKSTKPRKREGFIGIE
jgi:hypothetical protein